MSTRRMMTLGLLLLMTSTVQAAPSSMAKGRQTSEESLKYRYEMSLDVSALYVRDTRPIGGTDTGAKLNLGGMFTSWIGLDALGMMAVKSKSYLVGGDIKLVPIDWLFFKAGAGVYSDRLTRTLQATPIFGAGVTGRFTEYYYMVAEGIYFNGSDKGRNVGFGIGLGLIF